MDIYDIPILAHIFKPLIKDLVTDENDNNENLLNSENAIADKNSDNIIIRNGANSETIIIGGQKEMKNINWLTKHKSYAILKIGDKP
jgi:hypothetical protein